LLVVDEAQNLSIDALEELRMLSNFQLGSSALLQVFLLGQPEFRDLVRDAPELEQLRQRVIATHHLEAMEASEVEPYIVHRLTCAGWNGRPEITADAYSALYTETGGVPRKLNTLMNRVMLMGAVEQVDKLDCDMVVAVIADMAGKSFEYEASMSTVAPVEDKFQKPVEQEKMPDAVAATAVESSESRVEVLTQKVATEAVVTPISNAEIQALASRVALMEQRVTEQEAALRRVLSMMIEWMDRESNLESRFIQNNRAA
jgi:general secretion pathway protein A